MFAGYEPSVQRSDFGRRDPRFFSSTTAARFLDTPCSQQVFRPAFDVPTRFPTQPRVSLELVSLAHPTVTGHAHDNPLYSSANARIQMQTPWTGDCIPRITANGHRNCEHSSH